MADWHVSDSEPDGEDGPTGAPSVLGVRIDRAKVLELLGTVERRRTIELDCLCRVSRKEHKQRVERNGTGWKRRRVASPGGVRSAEEVSETASVRSTHTASTATECRDTRRCVTSGGHGAL